MFIYTVDLVKSISSPDWSQKFPSTENLWSDFHFRLYIVAKRLSSFINVGVRSGLSIYSDNIFCIHFGNLKEYLFIVLLSLILKKDNVAQGVLCATLLSCVVQNNIIGFTWTIGAKRVTTRDDAASLFILFVEMFHITIVVCAKFTFIHRFRFHLGKL